MIHQGTLISLLVNNIFSYVKEMTETDNECSLVRIVMKTEGLLLPESMRKVVIW